MNNALSKIQTRAKQIRRDHPRLQWTEAIKKASAQLKREGKIGKVHKVKRPAAKRKVVRRKIGYPGPSNAIHTKSNSMYPVQNSMSNAALVSGIKNGLKNKMGKAMVERSFAKTKKEKKRLGKVIIETRRKITKL